MTSPVSVQEPFLDLLVELDWASGRVVREYTFLLDPPGLPAAAATEPVTPARAGTPAQDRGSTGAARAGIVIVGRWRLLVRRVGDDAERSAGISTRSSAATRCSGSLRNTNPPT